jgi:hypothetical protein
MERSRIRNPTNGPFETLCLESSVKDRQCTEAPLTLPPHESCYYNGLGEESAHSPDRSTDDRTLELAVAVAVESARVSRRTMPPQCRIGSLVGRARRKRWSGATEPRGAPDKQPLTRRSGGCGSAQGSGGDNERGSPAKVVGPLHDAGVLVLSDVASLHHADRTVTAGVDGLILLSAGAGGQTGWANPLVFVRALRARWDGLLVLLTNDSVESKRET